MAFAFTSIGGRSDRIICHAWKIRPNGTFEAETNTGIMLFRRKDIQFTELHHDESNAHSWVCMGNLQRMIWIDFPDEVQALEFISLMERKFFVRNQNGMYDPF